MGGGPPEVGGQRSVAGGSILNIPLAAGKMSAQIPAERENIFYKSTAQNYLRAILRIPCSIAAFLLSPSDNIY